MSMNRFILPALGAAGATILFACGESPTGPPPPELDDVDTTTIVFLSVFNDENGGQGALNWTDFVEWNILAGCVDLHGNGFVDIWPNNGLYVDLDGSCAAGGTIESKEDIEFSPGNYVLEFWIAGNNRVNAPDTVLVQLGTLHEEEIVLQRRDQFRLIVRELLVTEPTSARLLFRNYGGDDHGMLLDLVRVRRIVE